MEHYKNWGQVPEHIKTKTQLRELRLKPAKEQKPIGTIYSGRAWRDLFDMNEAVSTKEPSLKQIEALEKARIKKEEMQTCHVCTCFIGEKLNTYNGKPICKSCDNDMYYKDLMNRLKNESFLVVRGDTSDLNPGGFVHLAIVDDSGNIVFNELLNPDSQITGGAFELHGFSNFDLMDKPLFKDVYGRLKGILEGRNVLFFDDFELPFFHSLCEKYGLEEIRFNRYDAAEIIYHETSRNYRRLTDDDIKRGNALNKAFRILSELGFSTNHQEMSLRFVKDKLVGNFDEFEAINNAIKLRFEEYEQEGTSVSDVLNYIFKKTLIDIDLTTFNDVLRATYHEKGQGIFTQKVTTYLALDKTKLESKLKRKFTNYPVGYLSLKKLFDFEIKTYEHESEYSESPKLTPEDILFNRFGNEFELHFALENHSFLNKQSLALKFDLFDVIGKHFSTNECKLTKDSLLDENRILDIDISNEVSKRRFYEKCTSSKFDFKIVYFDGERVYIDIDSGLKLEFIVA